MRARPLALLLLIAGALLPTLAWAQACPGMNQHLTAYARETATVTNSAVVTLTQSVYNAGGAVPLVALITVSTATINVLDDGTDPTTGVPPTSNGQPFAAGEHLLVCLKSIGKWRAIAQGTSGAISVVYYRAP